MIMGVEREVATGSALKAVRIQLLEELNNGRAAEREALTEELADRWNRLEALCRDMLAVLEAEYSKMQVQDYRDRLEAIVHGGSEDGE